MAVIGVMAISLIVATVITGATLNSLGYTSATRADVQSVAAAESGVDVVLARVQTEPCVTGVYTSTGNPSYTAQMSWSVGVDPAAAVWTNGCPTASAQMVRIVSTGFAAAKGVNGNTRGDARTVESIHSVTMPSTGVPANGAAVYAYQAVTTGGSGSVTTSSGNVASVHVRLGNFICSGDSPSYANIVLRDGSFSSDGSCKVKGSVWASKGVSLEGGAEIDRDVVAGEAFSLTSGKVFGSVWAGTTMNLTGNGTIGRSAYAKQTVTLGSTAVLGATAADTLWTNTGVVGARGGINIKASVIAKTVTGTSFVSGPRTVGTGSPNTPSNVPPMPLVPDWVDFGYKLSDWPGFVVRTITGAACADTNSIPTIVAATAANKVVIDARSCANGVVLDGSRKATFGADTAIFAHKFDLGGGASFEATKPVNVWLISPDEVENNLPTPAVASCTGVSGPIKIAGGFRLDTRIAAFVYTPCMIELVAGVKWRGQLYGGQTKIAGDASLAFSPVGLPGVDLDLGTDITGPTSPYAVLANQLSIRDLAN
ncbi:hypothetical protein GY24_02820 [Microterricola pindariensis]|uniref:Type 4 fimbrial biogenesis protein PilX N-terminal domain-containing protein n=2 Tax=Microterricola pindariensis TaxID=478010 RepID=A0ABX5AZV2_9MICO|nr:hypothetical protein GY24_02820 [Microterricola pindariensis]